MKETFRRSPYDAERVTYGGNGRCGETGLREPRSAPTHYLGGDSNPNLDSQINLATAAFNAAQKNYVQVQTTAFLAYATYKSAAEGAGLTVPPFTTWVIDNYPAFSASQQQMTGAQSQLDSLSTQRYGAGYRQLQAARARIAFTLGGAQNLGMPNSNNMEIVTATLAPPGSTKVLIGAPPPEEASKRVASYAPLYTLDASYAQKYAEWQAASGAGTIGNSITISSRSRDYSYSDFGWGNAARASWFGWFAAAGAQQSASGGTIAVNTSSTDFSMKVDFVGVGAFGIQPGPWWQNGSMISNFKNQLKQGHPDFFSENGSLARRASQLVLGFEPTVTLTMSASDYRQLKTSWQAQASLYVRVGPFSFGAAGEALSRKESMDYDDASASVKIGPIKSTMPVLLGVVSSKL